MAFRNPDPPPEARQAPPNWPIFDPPEREFCTPKYQQGQKLFFWGGASYGVVTPIDVTVRKVGSNCYEPAYFIQFPCGKTMVTTQEPLFETERSLRDFAKRNRIPFLQQGGNVASVAGRSLYTTDEVCYQTLTNMLLYEMVKLYFVKKDIFHIDNAKYLERRNGILVGMMLVLKRASVEASASGGMFFGPYFINYLAPPQPPVGTDARNVDWIHYIQKILNIYGVYEAGDAKRVCDLDRHAGGRISEVVVGFMLELGVNLDGDWLGGGMEKSFIAACELLLVTSPYQL